MTELREKVARDTELAKIDYWVDLDGYHARGIMDEWQAVADAAIRVCREHFAGVAERGLDPKAPLTAEERYRAAFIATAIREDGK